MQLRSQRMLFCVVILAISASFLAAEDILCSGKWKMIAAGHQATLGLLANGTLFGWGENVSGQLGLGESIRNVSSPTRVNTTETFSSVAIYGLNAYAITLDGRLFAWGRNSFGALGTNSTDTQYLPIQVGNDSDWLSVAPGEYHTLFLKKNGTLYICGRSSHSELSTGVELSSKIPLQIWPDTTWKSISASLVNSTAIRNDSKVFVWGKLRNETVGGKVYWGWSRTSIGGENKTYSQVSIGLSHTLAIDTEGNLFSWGENFYGQLGDGTFSDSFTPVVPVGTNGSKWKSVSAGEFFSIALREDGTLWSFGSIEPLQRGIATNDASLKNNTPRQIGHNIVWKSISAGQTHVFGITSDDFAFGWGRNLEGQLGDKTKEHRAIPGNCLKLTTPQRPHGPQISDPTSDVIRIFLILGAIAVVVSIGMFVYSKTRKSVAEKLLFREVEA